MTMQPKVTIILPVYNVEPYLRQCLDSVVNQTMREIQIVCVNDGSTDGSPTILEEYAADDSRIEIIHQENQGGGSARNAAYPVARNDRKHSLFSARRNTRRGLRPPLLDKLLLSVEKKMAKLPL